MTRWKSRDGDEYDASFVEAADAGHDVHGEATFVRRLEPRSVLDAGCGTGRVAIELARHGIDAVGVDLDPGMLEVARRKAPHLDWRLADLSSTQIIGADGALRRFDVVVAAGNVLLFVAPGSEDAVVRNLAAHLAPGGHLVTGFQLLPGTLDLVTYDAMASAAGLRLVGRYPTWEGRPGDVGDYAVSAHRAPVPAAEPARGGQPMMTRI